SGEIRIDGFLCPGHVSVIIGEKTYYPIAEKYGVPCVIAGFEPIDILEGIYRLLLQVQRGEGKVENVYRRAVSASGNIKAQQLMQEVFEVCDSEWRGLGIIKESGFKISSRYSFYDAQIRFPLKMDVFPEEKNNGCRCGEVLRGLIEPEECSLFARVCNPSNPLGPCMVSVEGACNIHYRFAGVESG
ncbi:hydrogenase formation protein HypD, partial [Candidatus Aerophobetes bacterium]|nr:hydrogenase formation protein HypD [Candidatus Aerophobetes bacterium]